MKKVLVFSLLLLSGITLANSEQNPRFKSDKTGNEHRYRITVQQNGVIILEQNSCLTEQGVNQRTQDLYQQYPGALIFYDLISNQCFPNQPGTGGGNGSGPGGESEPGFEKPE
ncbi:hypothetical protein HX017_14160 [Myroides marinus]|uniref:hypothetical protein n=1 Tax=Myroides TaxID=76831 RepID=UPI00074216CC|nr:MULTISPECIES: hypothetical protein [Myroides]KUF45166.1 hypothetical protein AS361_15190 [Myroides marinus]MDM1346419.1 hypothetical protein [Myroides marinus]MDM1349837.1 hypothetical protein [Myroides marinus]MDM1354800.1 hypothetical protein [Myroides marinus]MDM1357046.1 hypothetical protein [Myroides marinus]